METEKETVSLSINVGHNIIVLRNITSMPQKQTSKQTNSSCLMGMSRNIWTPVKNVPPGTNISVLRCNIQTAAEIKVPYAYGCTNSLWLSIICCQTLEMAVDGDYKKTSESSEVYLELLEWKQLIKKTLYWNSLSSTF